MVCRMLIDLAGVSSADPVLGLWTNTLLPCTAAATDSFSPSNFPKQTKPTVSSSAASHEVDKRGSQAFEVFAGTRTAQLQLERWRQHFQAAILNETLFVKKSVYTSGVLT